MRWKQYKIARERMVREHVYNRGVRDPRVLDAMLRVPRHLFIGRDAGVEAYADHSYPIGFQQTMSQPYMVAYLTEELRLSGEERVLEIGTGSGYHTAILSSLAQRVATVERVPQLAERARTVLRDLLFTNVDVKTDDGWRGWPELGPFDRVLLTAAAQQVPRALLAQLSDAGFLLGPVVRQDGKQEIVRLIRRGGKVEIERLIECSFVPLVRDEKRRATGTPNPEPGLAESSTS
ncbi:MAG TPA: protein-L-isoaspartate(D-aspartate) O-methyltransferase [Candidatus Krumholzibacteria bacterium]|nr:protein-L-isoaspartate(D-aspartate) O-methyltransferase [Candidatus Krumholzibacteria bacterium]